MTLCLICGSSDSEVKKLFCFPKNANKNRMWQERLGMVYQGTLNNQRRICNKHFSNDSFVPFTNTLKLKKDATPILIELFESQRTAEHQTRNLTQPAGTSGAAITNKKLATGDLKRNMVKTRIAPETKATEVKPDLSGIVHGELKRQKAVAAKGGPKEPLALMSVPSVSETKTQKQHWPDISTPSIEKIMKRMTRSDKNSKEDKSFKGTKMAFAHQDPDVGLTLEEAKKVKTWILGNIDQCQGTGVEPQFTACQYRAGALRITCHGQETEAWVRQLLRQGDPWEGAKLRFVEAKNLSKPVKTLVRIRGPPMEPEKILSRLEVQNQGLVTKGWKVVDREKDSRGQQLVILMDKTSWDTLATRDFRPFLNFTRIKFKAIVDKKCKADGKETTATEMEMNMEQR